MTHLAAWEDGPGLLLALAAAISSVGGLASAGRVIGRTAIGAGAVFRALAVDAGPVRRVRARIRRSGRLVVDVVTRVVVRVATDVNLAVRVREIVICSNAQKKKFKKNLKNFFKKFKKIILYLKKIFFKNLKKIFLKI